MQVKGKKLGFSLVEMSIVVLVVALLAAAIATGADLVKQAQMRKIVSDVEEITLALQTFKLKYGKLPGDFDDATSFFSSTDNGDGDGAVSLLAGTAGAGSSEVGRVFEHMSKAGIYAGDYVAGITLATSGVVANMVPEGPRKGRYIVTNYTPKGGYSFVNRNQIGGNTTNVIRFGGVLAPSVYGNTHVAEAIFSVREAIAMDFKIDDGLARSGKFTGHNKYWTSPGSTNVEQCLQFSIGATHNDAEGPTGGASYNPADTNGCNISFDLEL